MSTSEDKVKRLKEEGNECFKNQNYVTAIKYYTQGLNHKAYRNSSNSDSLSTDLLTLKQSLLLNRAKAYNHLDKKEEALKDATKCITTLMNSKLSYKARYTRAEINLNGNNFRDAFQDCDKILKVKLFTSYPCTLLI